ncbi:MAG: hypothetical protein A2W93_05050 [Bacteroidetes bacterium GWF2_43_63]|nr:MAG: hypothetical protein A2W94_12100 [Bacteroidetes bacterium GWE2_42_42]OFY56245.1 MAG: hypothetical protein A2W93_05050 [Bacteroidetes bacterium GWF2_43_63]HBG71919.1 hypothetical protein [Bacteroidales bacterium]HCB61820.1 hypothetical protein [Bacteroidales bacterium]HCY23842.1 hypothetical protein [Bacteroidales bacterium]
MKKIALVVLIIVTVLNTYSQSDTSKPDPGKFFADIHTFFVYDVNENTTPHTGFGINTAIIGYKKSLSQKVNATIIYDVTRTTNFTFPDTIGISSYFEGSKYTAFLKMAEIDWKVKPWAELCFGQLLNEQYLTVQDKHWGLRYVNTTMQEYFRFGNPADFGARIKFFPTKTLMLSATVVNGEGPFRYQDNESLFQYCFNAEYRPKEHLIFKVYADYQPHSQSGTLDRSAFSIFSGYKKGKWMAGAEYNLVKNNSYNVSTDLNGFSLFSSFKTGEKTAVFARADYLLEYGNVENEIYFMAGAEYRPVPALGLAVSIKRNTWLNTFMPGLNAGIRL